MGHVVKTGQEKHYRPTDVEFHRKLYAENAMPFLRLETATPTETEKTIEELKKQSKQREQEIKALKETTVKLRPLLDFINSFENPDTLTWVFDNLKTDFLFKFLSEKRKQVGKKRLKD